MVLAEVFILEDLLKFNVLKEELEALDCCIIE
jgi:hypothetical protein